MKKIDRLRQKLQDTKVKQMALYRQGQYVQGARLNQRIKDLEAEIEEAEAYEPHRLSEIIDHETLRKHKIAEKMVKMHLASDYLAECAADLKDTLSKLGIDQCSIFPMVEGIFKQSQDFASVVCHPQFAGLSDFIVEDEAYIEAVNLLTDAYLEKHLALTDD